MKKAMLFHYRLNLVKRRAGRLCKPADSILCLAILCKLVLIFTELQSAARITPRFDRVSIEMWSSVSLNRCIRVIFIVTLDLIRLSE